METSFVKSFQFLKNQHPRDVIKFLKKEKLNFMVDPDFFHQYYQKRNWRDHNGKKINWRKKAIQWETNPPYQVVHQLLDFTLNFADKMFQEKKSKSPLKVIK